MVNIIVNSLLLVLFSRFIFVDSRSYKEVTEADLKHPLIHGSGKASRLLATIGVTRGLGDHDLLALNHLTDTPIKPFLSSVPEVNVLLICLKRYICFSF